MNRVILLGFQRNRPLCHCGEFAIPRVVGGRFVYTCLVRFSGGVGACDFESDALLQIESDSESDESEE